MKKFNLEEALAGKPVVTRDGRKVTRLHLFKSESKYPLYGVVDEDILSFTREGSFNGSRKNQFDLFMASSDTVTKWVNVYSGGPDGYYTGSHFYDTEDGASEKVAGNNYIATVQITFEI